MKFVMRFDEMLYF